MIFWSTIGHMYNSCSHKITSRSDVVAMLVCVSALHGLCTTVELPSGAFLRMSPCGETWLFKGGRSGNAVSWAQMRSLRLLAHVSLSGRLFPQSF
jgi:hypothetical protein